MLEVVQIRKVVPREIDAGPFENEPPERYVRELPGYISEWDMQQLFCKSVEAPDVADDQRPPHRAPAEPEVALEAIGDSELRITLRTPGYAYFVHLEDPDEATRFFSDN